VLLESNVETRRRELDDRLPDRELAHEGFVGGRHLAELEAEATAVELRDARGRGAVPHHACVQRYSVGRADQRQIELEARSVHGAQCRAHEQPSAR
jgi:hypothetical protein